MRQGSLGTAYADFRASHLYAINEQSQIFAASGLLRITQLPGDQIAKSRDHLGRDLAPSIIELPLGHLDIDRERALLRGDVAELGFDLGIVGGDAAEPHQLDDVRALSLEQRHTGSQLLQLLPPLALGVLATVDERLEKRV